MKILQHLLKKLDMITIQLSKIDKDVKTIINQLEGK